MAEATRCVLRPTLAESLSLCVSPAAHPAAPGMALRLWTLLSATSAAFGLVVRPSLTPSSRAAASRTAPPALGLFDAFSKAFENKDYSNSPAQYEQTNARASHILVSTEAEAQKIKDDLAAGTVTFDEAALQYSSCASSQQGGRLGKFYPGAMAKEVRPPASLQLSPACAHLHPIPTHSSLTTWSLRWRTPARSI